jgi:hypothetical protein
MSAEYTAYMEGTKSYKFLCVDPRRKRAVGRERCVWEACKDMFIHFSVTFYVDTRARDGMIEGV